MRFAFRKNVGLRLSLSLAILALACPAFAGSAGSTLSVVFDTDNLPYSSRGGDTAGLNVDIARLLAAELDLRLDTLWVDTEKHGLLSFLIGEESGAAEAQAAVGVPVESRTVEDEERVGTEVLFSEPFASTRYVLVTQHSRARVSDFQSVRLTPLAVESGSVAGMNLWDKGYVVRGMPSQTRILEALADGDVAYGVLWSNAGWYIERNDRFRGSLRVSDVKPDVPGLEWNVGVAVSREHAYLVGRVNEAVAALRETGAFKPIFEFYDVPYFEPIRAEE